MNPYYAIMKLPSEQTENHAPAAIHAKSKDNLAAWMVARADGEHYGHLLVYRFPNRN